MTPTNIVFAFFGIVFIVWGISMLFKPTREFTIRLTNSMRGIQTKITTITVWTYRIYGILAIIFGALMLFASGLLY